MPKHKSEDYKISAVQYYLDNNTTYANTCKIYKCNERSLKRWIGKINKIWPYSFTFFAFA